jgi:hypothetical protein
VFGAMPVAQRMIVDCALERRASYSIRATHGIDL